MIKIIGLNNGFIYAKAFEKITHFRIEYSSDGCFAYIYDSNNKYINFYCCDGCDLTIEEAFNRYNLAIEHPTSDIAEKLNLSPEDAIYAYNISQ